MSLTNRYSFDWIVSARTATPCSVRSNCIRCASEYRVPSCCSYRSTRDLRRDSSARVGFGKLNYPVSRCLTSRNEYPIMADLLLRSDSERTRWEGTGCGGIDSICIFGDSHRIPFCAKAPLPAFLPSLVVLRPKSHLIEGRLGVNYFNFLSNAILEISCFQTSFLYISLLLPLSFWERSIPTAIDPWNLLFL